MSNLPFCTCYTDFKVHKSDFITFIVEFGLFLKLLLAIVLLIGMKPSSFKQPTPIILSICCLVILYASSLGSALDRKRAFSLGSKLAFHRSDSKIDYNDPKQYVSEDALITQNPKSNTISKVLRYVHKRTGDHLYELPEPSKKRLKKDVNDISESGQNGIMKSVKGLDAAHMEQPSLSGSDFRTADQVIEDACKGRPTPSCLLMAKWALKKDDETKKRIAFAIRKKPEYVDGPKVLYHKMFESVIRDVEQNNIDDKIEFAIDTLLSVNPATKTGMIAAKLAQTALKPVLNSQLDKRLST
jgi:hypothetical protein